MKKNTRVNNKKSPKKRVAVFDLDGTVFRSSLLIELLEELIEEKIFPKKARKIYSRELQNWLNRKGSYEDYIEKVILAYHRFIKKKKAEDVWKAARKVVSAQKNFTYRFTRCLVSELKKNYYLLAISGSPQEMVREFGKKFGFDRTYSRIFETDKKGRFTGKILFEDMIKDKGKILKIVVKKKGLSLKGSIGVGDTEADIPFLKLVNYPIAFNPNLRLYRYSQRRKWPVIVERKNVVYRLNRGRLPQAVKTVLKNLKCPR